MAGWEPTAEGVTEIVQFLDLSSSSQSRHQREIYERLEGYKAIPEFNNYLVFILSHMPDVDMTTRAGAGLLLKRNLMGSTKRNTVEGYKALPVPVQEYIKSEVIHSIGDKNALIRSTVAVVITTCAREAGFDGWPELLSTLSQLLDSEDPLVVEGTCYTFSKLCEDMPEEIDTQQNGRPLNYLIPKWMSFFSYTDYPKIRHDCLGCISTFILLRSNALLNNVEEFVQHLYNLAEDPFIPVRRVVCESMVNLLQVRPDLLLSKMDTVIEYMLFCSSSDDELLALEACEFWALFSEAQVAKKMIRPYLPDLMPVLLKNMVYSEFDVMTLGGDQDDDCEEPDHASSIAPRFHYSSAKTVGDDEDNDEDEDDDENYPTDWNLRKSAAAAVDVLASVYQAELLEYIIPVIEERMNSPEWDERESAILALGAIAHGCAAGLNDYLPPLIGHLLDGPLNDAKPLIRKITCWTLSRYAGWVVYQKNHDVFLGPLLAALLERVLDRNKQVQEAACSALASLEEEACGDLVPYLDRIVEVLEAAFHFYQARNLRILCDAVGTLAEHVKHELAQEQYVSLLMPALLEKWFALDSEDTALYPLMEALNSMAAATGEHFMQYAEAIFERCRQMVQVTMEAHQSDLDDPPDKDIIVCALDLLSAVIENVGPSIEPLVAESNLLLLLQHAMVDDSPDVRQSAFAVVGDLAKTCMGHLVEYLGEYLPLLIENLNPSFMSPCNNAAWAIGEICMQVGEQMEDYVPAMVNKLVPIINRPRTNVGLKENTAITIGRLGLKCPEIVAPRLEEFIHNWCLTLRQVRDDFEKASAFQGVCKMIVLNPDGVANRFVLLCDAFASWRKPPDDLHEKISEILYGFRNSMPPQEWLTFYNSEFPQALRSILDDQYQLGQ